MRTLVCIVCPRGCRLVVGDPPECAVTGNSCKRGALYGREEVLDPKRVVTATCRALRTGHAEPDAIRRVPVRTTAGIPKHLVGELAAFLGRTQIAVPVPAGTIIIENWKETGVAVVVTRDIG